MRSLLIALIMLTSSAAAMPHETARRAFAGEQTYWVEQITDGLSFPSSMAWLHDGEWLIAEKTGALRIVRHGKLDSQAVGGVPASFFGQNHGLKDIVLDPDYRTNQTLYLFLTEGTFEEHYAAVYRARYSAGALRDVTRIFRSRDGLGGAASAVITTRMIFLPDKTLLFGVAEDHHRYAQDLKSHLGKLLRINEWRHVYRRSFFHLSRGTRAARIPAC